MERGNNLLLQDRKSTSRVFLYSTVRSYILCIMQKNLPYSEHRVHKLYSLRIVGLKLSLHEQTGPIRKPELLLYLYRRYLVYRAALPLCTGKQSLLEKSS